MLHVHKTGDMSVRCAQDYPQRAVRAVSCSSVSAKCAL